MFAGGDPSPISLRLPLATRENLAIAGRKMEESQSSGQ
jgi:hypothetical protein